MSDEQFAAAVLSNQVNFDKEGYRLKKFSLLEPDEDAESSFTKNVQKYINHIAKTRLSKYKKAMQDMRTGIDLVTLLHSAAFELNIKGYSHPDFLKFLADVCTYIRCSHLRRIEGINFCPVQLIKNTLSKLRDRHLFLDVTFTELDVWVSNEIKQYEAREGKPMSVRPVELSLD